MPTFELTAETRLLENGILVHRIRCTTAIPSREWVPSVAVGDLGGWVQSMTVGEGNLAHDRLCANAWVADEACVTGDAMLCDNARVSGTALICDDAWVRGDARVSGASRVCDEALISGEAQIDDEVVVEGAAMVSGGARVDGHACVSGDAEIWGFSHVFEEARVGGEAIVIDHAVVRGRAHIRENALVTGHAQVRGDAVLAGRAEFGGRALVTDGAHISAGLAVVAPVCIRGHARIERSDHLLVVQSFAKDRKPIALFRTEESAEVNFGIEDCVTVSLQTFPSTAERMIDAVETSDQLKAVWRRQVAAIDALFQITVAAWDQPTHSFSSSVELHLTRPWHAGVRPPQPSGAAPRAR